MNSEINVMWLQHALKLLPLVIITPTQTQEPSHVTCTLFLSMIPWSVTVSPLWAQRPEVHPGWQPAHLGGLHAGRHRPGGGLHPGKDLPVRPEELQRPHKGDRGTQDLSHLPALPEQRQQQAQGNYALQTNEEEVGGDASFGNSQHVEIPNIYLCLSPPLLLILLLLQSSKLGSTKIAKRPSIKLSNSQTDSAPATGPSPLSQVKVTGGSV